MTEFNCHVDTNVTDGGVLDEPNQNRACSRAELGLHARCSATACEAGGQTITLPPPRFVDGQTADQERPLLREVAESDRAVDEMLRDSVTAPYIIKVRDQKASGATIRMADLWFVVYAPLEKIDPVREVARADQKKVEVANMSFETRMLKADEIRAAGIKPGRLRGRPGRLVCACPCTAARPHRI